MKRNIRFRSMKEIVRFVNKASKCKGSVVVKAKDKKVSGKAMIGMLSLDLTKEVTVQFDEQNKEFDEFTSNMV